MAEPVDLPVIEMAFLNGQESPTIETAEADFNQLGSRCEVTMTSELRCKIRA